MSKAKIEWEKGFNEINKATAMTARFVHEKVLEITATLPKGSFSISRAAKGPWVKGSGLRVLISIVEILIQNGTELKVAIFIGWISIAIFLTKTVVLTV